MPADSFTDSAIGSSRLNGEHREKVLQRWDGDGNGDGFDLDSDTVRKLLIYEGKVLR